MPRWPPATLACRRIGACVGAAGAGGDEPGQQVLVGRMHELRLGRQRAVVPQRRPVARGRALGEPGAERGAGRDLGHRLGARQAQAQVVRDRAGADDPHAFVDQRAQRGAELEQLLRASSRAGRRPAARGCRRAGGCRAAAPRCRGRGRRRRRAPPRCRPIAATARRAARGRARRRRRSAGRRAPAGSRRSRARPAWRAPASVTARRASVCADSATIALGAAPPAATRASMARPERAPERAGRAGVQRRHRRAVREEDGGVTGVHAVIEAPAPARCRSKRLATMFNGVDESDRRPRATFRKPESAVPRAGDRHGFGVPLRA